MTSTTYRPRPETFDTATSWSPGRSAADGERPGGSSSSPATGRADGRFGQRLPTGSGTAVPVRMIRQEPRAREKHGRAAFGRSC
ncbi:hypothetical protein [Protofrankia symbiont of Coriaria ruscifolia]|uniref:hypothetical protein n=1 Tax=Protofrankia symbiont of Coriaria ruscifolia TaxID=1306542 RepID=UPI001A9473CC|nr:hypothetical protein [Protofrankia symbiont of Coriaria ruscifolia]